MKKIIFILFLITCTNVVAQDAEWYCRKGEEYAYAKLYDAAINCYKKADELSAGYDAACQYNIGACYLWKNDYEHAFLWYKKAANNGLAEAQYNLGGFYENGYGVQKDKTQAIYWYHKAAMQNYADAYPELAALCYQTGDYATSVYWGMRGFDNPNIKQEEYAQCCLYRAFALEEGVGGLKQDFASAIEYFNRFKQNTSNSHNRQFADDQIAECRRKMTQPSRTSEYTYRPKPSSPTNRPAVDRDAESYLNEGNDWYKKKEYEKAVACFRKAAEQGNAAAQYKLGMYYESGLGVAKNYVQAANWYRKASEQGYAEAQYTLGICYDEGIGVVKDQVQAANWYRKAAEQGHVKAQYNLGVYYKAGQGVPEDQAKAFYWYHKAAEQGMARAQDEIGRRYSTGEGVEKNEETAVYWYRKAAEQGDGNSMIRLGGCYYYGLGVPEDKSQGKYWMKKGLDSNSTLEGLKIAARALLPKD